MARILVIDDEAPLRLLLRRLLERQGHCVDEAANGAEGLRCYAAKPAALVITDIQMPVMNGLTFMLALRCVWPAAVVLAISGDVHGLTQAQMFTPHTLAKPFEPQHLLAAVQTLVATSAFLPEGRPFDPGSRGAACPRPEA